MPPGFRDLAIQPRIPADKQSQSAVGGGLWQLSKQQRGGGGAKRKTGAVEENKTRLRRSSHPELGSRWARQVGRPHLCGAETEEGRTALRGT